MIIFHVIDACNATEVWLALRANDEGKQTEGKENERQHYRTQEATTQVQIREKRSRRPREIGEKRGSERERERARVRACVTLLFPDHR